MEEISKMGAVSVIVTISIIVFGFAFWMRNKNKPKRVGYAAEVYRKVGTGEKVELKLFENDFLIMRKRAVNVKDWELEKLGLLLTTEPSAENIYEKGKIKYVKILYDQGKIALLKPPKDDTKNDVEVFESYDYDKNAYCELRRVYEKKRLKDKKNPLEIISKWVMMALLMFGMIGIAYVMSDGYVIQSENMLKASENYIIGAEIFSNATSRVEKIQKASEGRILSSNQAQTNTNPNEVKKFE